VRILASGSQRSSCGVAELVGCHALRDGCQSPTEPLECAFLGVDLRRRQATLLELVELARKRLDLADEPSELTPSAGQLERARGVAGGDRLSGERSGGAGAPGFDGDGQGDRGDDATEDLEGRRQRDVCDDDAREDGR